ncbi:MAG TPA: class IV adenylate cyclase [Granulicella sp.]
MQSAEIELKFPVPDPTALQSRLPALGFDLVTPRTFESNTLYDTPDRTLRSSHQILRIRQYGPLWVLTHKRIPDGVSTAEEESARYKTRIETETTVADGVALAEVFRQMGYVPAFRYEKYRTEWSFPGLGAPAHLVIDETPIGNFAELEGPPDWIDRTVAALRIDPASCITLSYGKLFLNWKEQNQSPAENLTFDEIPVPAAAL